MRLHRHWTDLPVDARGAVLALGNFDGVHRGHQAVIAVARQVATEVGAAAGVLTFEPHPRTLFRPDDPPFRLTPLRLKVRELQALGLDPCFVLAFDRTFSTIGAEAFVDEVLVSGLGVRAVVVGYDFVFGHGRGGTVDRLSRWGEARGFSVHVVTPAGDDGIVFSSTAAREALKAGDPRRAAAILGRDWEIEGRVEHGEKRGRTIGFPTANVLLGDYLRPAFGVYAVRAGVDAGAATVWHPGVANLGRRPTVGGLTERLEVHLFDFSGDLYGRHLRVRMVDFIRPEMRFEGLDALKAQIAQDAARARAIVGG
jgi:riboflavin kinase / FMN adenylyltransferase